MNSTAELVSKPAFSFFVLDDEFTHAEHAQYVLQHAGWQVFDYDCDPVVGEKKILELEPDIVLLDIRFGSRTEGIRILKSVRNEAERLRKRLPYAVFVTGLKDDTTLAEVAGTRGAVLLGKPISDEDLLDACQAAVSNLPHWNASCAIKSEFGLWPEDVNRERLLLIQAKLESRLDKDAERNLTKLQEIYEKWLESNCLFDTTKCEKLIRELSKQ